MGRRRGEMLEEVAMAHDSAITSLVWAPAPLPGGDGGGAHELLATAAADKKVKLWRSPV